MKILNHWGFYGIGLLLFGAALFGSLCLGVYPIPTRTVLRIVLALIWPGPLPEHPPWSDTEIMVVQIVRLPRILLATLAGAGLGLSGAALQGLFRNPLVGPDIIGVSAGAACGGVGAMLLGWTAYEIVGPALLGGLMAVLLASGLARLAKGGMLALVLAGIIVAAFFSATLTLLEYLADPLTSLPRIIYWLMGSFAGANTQAVAVAGAGTLGAGAVLLGLRWRLNLLSLGDTDAAALGLNIARFRWAVVALSALIVATQVSVSGIVGWIGLIIPHFARMLVGPDHRRLMPAAGLLGGVFMLGVDDIARSIASQELPVGLLTAFIGTPVFAVLFWRTQGRGWGRN